MKVNKGVRLANVQRICYPFVDMARPPRIEFPGAFCHIIVRGNQKQAIFLDDQDRIRYIERLKRYKEHHRFILYAYTLMTNHVHLLIETTKSPVSKIMHVINFTYTQYFNKKYGKVGHLFQGRYKSYLCDRDEYLLSLVRYIHLNPVRAGLVKGLDEYKWSSHKDYLNGNKGFIEIEKVLRLFSERPFLARRLYEDFVNEAINLGSDKSLYKVANQQVLGSDRFIDKIEKKVEELEKPIRRPSLREVQSAVEKVTNIKGHEIFSRSRDSNVMYARGILVGACREAGYKLVDLQPKLQRDLSVLSRWAKFSEREKGRKAVRQVLRYLNARLQA
jgi:putative transposase